jgi:tetratricopeptide (TPR) repeat protein
MSETLSPAAKEAIREIYQLIRAGNMSDALSRLGLFEYLCRGEPGILNENEGAILIDIGKTSGSTDSVRRGISLLTATNVADLTGRAKSAHWYNLGNGYAEIYYAKKMTARTHRALDADFRLARECYRRAIAVPAFSAETKARLFTNYGILLRTVGRHVEEIEAYDTALDAVPGFAMALWHKSRALRIYSRLVERPTKGSALLEAWNLLKKCVESGLEPVYQAKAEKELAELDRVLTQPEAHAHRHTAHVANSDIEAKYIKFCVDNRLYLHPCPVDVHEAYQDPLSVRFPTSVKDEFFELRSDELALIKREYAAARFLLFILPISRTRLVIRGSWYLFAVGPREYWADIRPTVDPRIPGRIRDLR